MNEMAKQTQGKRNDLLTTLSKSSEPKNNTRAELAKIANVSEGTKR